MATRESARAGARVKQAACIRRPGTRERISRGDVCPPQMVVAISLRASPLAGRSFVRAPPRNPLPAGLETLVLPVHAVATLAMFGLIWMVQLVHYPLMAWVGRESFPAWHERHLRWMTWVVGPFMLAEVAAALCLLESPPAGAPAWLPWAGIALVMVVWISTATLQVPMHRRLERGWDERAHRMLVRTNWVRTAAWTARAGIVVALFA